MSGLNHTISISEFRKGLTKYLLGTETIGITKNGHVVGYLIPILDTKNFKVELEELKSTTPLMEAFLRDLGVTEEDIITEFDQQRKTGFISG